MIARYETLVDLDAILAASLADDRLDAQLHVTAWKFVTILLVCQPRCSFSPNAFRPSGNRDHVYGILFWIDITLNVTRDASRWRRASLSGMFHK